MPSRIPDGKVALYMYVRPETTKFLKVVVRTSRYENGRFRSMGVLVEILINFLYWLKVERGRK